MKKFAKAAILASAACAYIGGYTDNLYAMDSAGNYVVIIDAGHGGNDCGATSSTDTEDALNWSLATSIKAELQTYNGVKVYLTRGSAEWNTNTSRGRMGSQLGADLAVSIHNNSSTDGAANGVEAYGTVKEEYRESVASLCTNICDKVSALGLKNGGYRTRESTDEDGGGDFYTFIAEAVKSGTPACIVEHAYLSNTSDAAFIHNPDNQLRVAVADATAIAEHFGLVKRGVKSGDNIELIRGYSAYMVTDLKDASYSSSKSDVAYVSDNGVITAVGAGSATITCTGSDGDKETVEIKVPEVSLEAISSAINPTFYEPYNVSDYVNHKIIVKGIFTDGQVSQIDEGFTVGKLPESNENIYDIPIEYKGLSCTLRIYGTGTAGLSSYSEANSYPTGDNVDALKYPVVIDGLNSNVKVSTGDRVLLTGSLIAKEEPEAPASETEGETMPAYEDPSDTTQEIEDDETSTSISTPDNTDESTSEYSETGEESTTMEEDTEEAVDANTTPTDKPKADFFGIPLWIPIVVAVFLLGIVICGVIYLIKKHKKDDNNFIEM